MDFDNWSIFTIKKNTKTMQKLFFTVVLLLFCTSVSMYAQKDSPENLLTNGSFIEGTTGWDIYLSDPNLPIKAQIIERAASYHQYGLADNYVGTNFVELDNQSAIQQKVNIKAVDEPHTLVFAYAHRPSAGDKQLIVTINGNPIWTYTIKNTSENGKFTYKVLKFTPTTKEVMVAFNAVSLNGDKEKGVLLTDILLNEEPAVDIDLFYEY